MKKKKIYEMFKIKSEEELLEIYSEDARESAQRETWMRDVAFYFVNPSILDLTKWVQSLRFVNLRRGCLTDYVVANWNFNIHSTIAYK